VTRLLFVCTGNICRSPTADAVARAVSLRDGLGWIVDSVGTGGWHVGEHPDVRAVQAGAARGYDLSRLSARQLVPVDFNRFDHVIALDGSHLRDMQRLAPPDATARMSRLLDWLPDGPGGDVPDPYYGDLSDFEHVLDLVEAAVAGLAQQLQPNG
jgi:protein-tyrosine phosphatase